MILEKFKHFVKQLNIKVIVVIFILLYMIAPIVQRATSTFLTTYFYMVIVVVTLAFTFIMCRLRYIKEYLFFLIPFLIYEILRIVNLNSSDVLLMGYQMAYFLLPICLGYFLFYHSDKQDLYAKVFFIATAITVITTIVGCIANPNAARILATTSDSQDATAIMYDWQNIGGYSLVYQTILVYPLAVMALKLKKMNIVVFVLVTIAMYSLVINAEYTLALILMMFSTLLLFINRNTTTKRLILIIVVGGIVVVVFHTAVVAVITYISDLIGKAEMSEKLTAAFTGGEAVESLEDNRVALYMQSLTTFLKHPLFGGVLEGENKIGGHSFILDTLGSYGLFGAALMFFIYRGVYKIFIKPFSGRYGYIYAFWTLLETIALSALNSGMWASNLCLFAPILICAIYGEESAKMRLPKPNFVKSPVKFVESPTVPNLLED